MCIWASIREKQNWIWERVVSFGNLYIILKGGGEENVGLQRKWMTFRKGDWSGEEEMKEVWCLWLCFPGCGSSVGVLSCDESSYPVDENSGEGIEDKRVPFGETLSLVFLGFFLTFNFVLGYILAWRIPWTEEPGRLQSMGSRRVRHDLVTSLSLYTFMHWRRKWQPTPVFLPGESQGQRGLVGCRLWGHTESDTTEAT